MIQEPLVEILGTKVRLRIIDILSREEDHELNISKLISEAHSNHENVERACEYLVSQGILQERKFGRIRLFRLKVEDIDVKNLSKIFNTLYK